MKEAMTGLGRAVVIILILLVVMNIAKGFMRDPNKKEEVIINPSIVDDKDKDDGKKKNQDFDNDYDYESIYDKFNFKTLEGFYGNDFKKLYYDKADFTNEYYLYLSVINQTRNNYIFVCNNDFSIKESDVNNKIKEIVKRNIEIVDCIHIGDSDFNMTEISKKYESILNTQRL